MMGMFWRPRAKGVPQGLIQYLSKREGGAKGGARAKGVPQGFDLNITSSNVQIFTAGLFIFPTKKYRFCFILPKMNG